MSQIQHPHPSDWSLERLVTLDPQRLLELTRRAARTLGVCKLLLGRCLLAIDRGEIECGACTGGIHLVMLQGVHRREALEVRRVAESLEGLPLLQAAAEEGTVPWASLREIVRKATDETEARWLELARKLSYRRIERLVRYTRAGEMPKEDSAAESEPDEVLLQLRLPAEVAQLLQTAARQLSERARTALPLGQVLEYLVAGHLAGATYPSPDQIQELREEAARDIAARRAAAQREQRPVDEPVDEPARVDELEEPGQELAVPWEAVAAEEEPCPGGSDLVLARPARVAHWENPRLRFNSQSRGLTTPQRREILRRDGYCCSTPGCPHKLWLAVHHIVFYCLGGVTLPHNLVLVCGRYVTPVLCNSLCRPVTLRRLWVRPRRLQRRGGTRARGGGHGSLCQRTVMSTISAAVLPHGRIKPDRTCCRS